MRKSRVCNKDSKFCVYFHYNSNKNEIFYVGMGVDDRPYTYMNRSKHWKSYTQKYGFEVYVVKSNLLWKEACELEIYYISKFGRSDFNEGTLINHTNGGDGNSDGCTKGHKPWNKGMSCPQETRDKISNSLKGEKNFNFGKHFSEEHRKKIAESNRITQSKPILQYTKDGEFIKEFPSTKVASIETGINNATIGLYCRYKRGSGGGYNWEFKNKENG